MIPVMSLRGIVTLLWCILLVPQLHAATVKLTVRVIDAVTLQGIAGASARVIQIGAGGNQPFSAQLATDMGGTFTVEVPARSRLWVAELKAAGYAPLDPNTHVDIAAEPVIVTYTLTRTAAISGRVVDADSADPIVGLAVEPLLVSWVRGRRELQRAFKLSVTGKDGSFEIGDLRPGGYVLDLNSYLADSNKPVLPAEGYPSTIWPGAGDFQGAAPFNVEYGGTLRLGDIKLRKREPSKLAVAVAGGACSAGQIYEVLLQQFSFSSTFTRGVAHAPCGKDATFEQVTPGDYEIVVQAPWQSEAQRERAAFPTRIVKGDEKVSVVVTPPITIHGRITMDHEGPVPVGISVRLWPRGSKLAGYFSHIASFGDFKVTAGGTFEGLSYVPAGGEIEVDLSHLPAGYYVREVRYGGTSSLSDSFIMHPDDPNHDLTVAISDRAARLSGTVRTGEGNLVSEAKVLLSPWPPDVVTEYPFGVEEASSSVSGGYSFAHLRPGTYRAIAVPAAVRPRLEEPEVMLTLLTSAESFELAESAAVVRLLTPVAPR